MQRLINDNEIDHIFLNYRSENDIITGLYEQILDIEPVLTIPENPTNGSLVKSMFPSVVIRVVTESQIGISFFDNQNEITWIPIEWWNAPYRMESEDKEDDT